MIDSVEPLSCVLWAVALLAAGMYPLGFMMGAPCSPCCEKCTCTTIESLSVAVHWNLSAQVRGYLYSAGYNVDNSIQPVYSVGQPRYPLGVVNPFAAISPSGTVYNVPRVPAEQIPDDVYISKNQDFATCFYLYQNTFGDVTLSSQKFGPQRLGITMAFRVTYDQNTHNLVVIQSSIRFAGQIIVNLPNGEPYVDGFVYYPTTTHYQGCAAFATYTPYEGVNTRTLSFDYGPGSFPTWSAALTITGANNPLP